MPLSIMGTGLKAPELTGDWSDSQERMWHHKFSVHLAKPFSASSPLLSARCLKVIRHHFLFTSSGFTSLLVKSFTQSMKQFSVTLLYVPRNSLNCNVSRETVDIKNVLRLSGTSTRAPFFSTCLIWSDSDTWTAMTLRNKAHSLKRTHIFETSWFNCNQKSDKWTLRLKKELRVCWLSKQRANGELTLASPFHLSSPFHWVFPGTGHFTLAANLLQE